MKHCIIITFIFLFSISSFSQVERIDLGSWYLHSLLIDSQSNISPINSDGEQITTQFNEDSSGVFTFGSNICESIGGFLNYNSGATSFTTSEVYSTLGGCNYAEGVNFEDVGNNESSFIAFFSYQGIFTYEILPENLDFPRTLIITASNGNTATYQRTLLSSSKLRNHLSFKIYPNPVQNELNISSEKNLKNYSVQIFGVIGKLKISKQLSNSTSINTESLIKGVYFIVIKDDLGNSTTKKFIKI